MRAGFRVTGKSQSRPGDEDLFLVSRACRYLELLDFEFFRTAWRRWYGSEPDDAVIEPGFVTYLQQQRAPGYVRQFAREVLAHKAAEEARAAALPKDPPPLEVVGSAGILLMAMVCLSIIIRL